MPIDTDAIVRTGESEHTVQVISEKGEMMRLFGDLASFRGGAKEAEELFVKLLFVLPRAHAHIANRLRHPYGVEGTTAHSDWQEDKALLREAEELWNTIAPPNYATPMPRPHLAAWGTTYDFQLEARENMGTLDADHAKELLPFLFERRDKKAISTQLVTLAKVYKIYLQILDSQDIITPNTKENLRSSEFTALNAEAEKGSMPALTSAIQQDIAERRAQREADREADEDEDRFGWADE